MIFFTIFMYCYGFFLNYKTPCTKSPIPKLAWVQASWPRFVAHETKDEVICCFVRHETGRLIIFFTIFIIGYGFFLKYKTPCTKSPLPKLAWVQASWPRFVAHETKDEVICCFVRHETGRWIIFFTIFIINYGFFLKYKTPCTKSLMPN